MKIVFVSKEFPPSRISYGIGTYTAETAHYLASQGHRVTVICASDDACSSQDVRQGNLRVMRLPDDEVSLRSSMSRRWLPWSSRLALRYSKRVADCLDQLIDAGEAEIVEFPGYRGESSVWAKRPRRIPMLVRMHGFTGWVDRCWKDKIVPVRRARNKRESHELLCADHVTSVSKILNAKLLSHIVEPKTSTLYNGIDCAEWSRHVGDDELIAGRADILFAGSVTAVKGVLDLVEAASKMRADYGWRGKLLLFGRCDPHMEMALRHKCKHLEKDSGWLKILGHVSRKQLASNYAAAGVCCFPSLIEPFGYTALEAMASGAVVVGSRGTGMSEIIEDEVSGFLTSSHHATTLAATLWATLSLDDKKRARISAAAQTRARQSFDISVIASQMILLFESVIEQFHPRFAH